MFCSQIKCSSERIFDTMFLSPELKSSKCCHLALQRQGGCDDISCIYRTATVWLMVVFHYRPESSRKACGNFWEFCTDLGFYLITATTAWTFSCPCTFLFMLQIINVLLANHQGICRQRWLLVWNAAVKMIQMSHNCQWESFLFFLLFLYIVLLRYAATKPSFIGQKHSQKCLKVLFAFTFKHTVSMWTTSGLRGLVGLLRFGRYICPLIQLQTCGFWPWAAILTMWSSPEHSHKWQGGPPPARGWAPGSTRGSVRIWTISQTIVLYVHTLA